jgi:tetratricopeptide (TPR) repeat protein
MLRRQLEQGISGPSQVGEFSIIRVERGNRPDLALLYTVDWSPRFTTACRWWLVRNGRNWRLFDWERLDYEQSLAFGWAVQDTINSDPNSYNYTALRNAIQSNHRQQGGVNRPGRRTQDGDLARMIDAPLPEVIHDVAKFDLGWALVWQHRPVEAIRACSALKRPEDHPGHLIIRAQAYNALGQHERALADARRYQEIAGRDPLALAEEAEALENLGRTSEAAECWSRMLALAPYHTWALSNFCRLADERQSQQLGELLFRTRQPIETAVQEARSALGRDDIEWFERLAALVQAQSPQAVELDVLKAHGLQYEGQPEQAAALFRQASTRDTRPRMKEELFNQFLSAMATAGKAAEGYAVADDPKKAFEFYTTGFEEDESIVDVNQLRALLTAHQKRVPGDARAEYLAGLLLLRDEKYGAADDKFRSALGRAAGTTEVKVKTVENKADNEYTVTDYTNAQSADAELAELCRSGRIEALFRQGRWQDAYHTFGQTPDVFRQLAQLCEREGSWDQLRELIVQHQAANPSDRWRDYYRAKELRERGDSQSALAALRRAERGDEPLPTYCRSMKTDLLIEADKFDEAILNAADRSQILVDLISRLTVSEDWQRINQLVEQYGTSDPAVLNAWTHALWRQRKYEAIGTVLGGEMQWLNSAQPVVVQALHDRRVRSLLRLGRLTEARAAAEQASGNSSDDVPLIMVLLAEGNWEEVNRRFENVQLKNAILPESIENDPELKQLLLHPDLEGLRHRLAWPLHERTQGIQSRITLLCRDAPETNAGDLQERLNRLGSPQATIVEIPPANEGLRQSYRIETDGCSLMVTIGQAPYWKVEGHEQLPRDRALAALLREHGGYIVLEHENRLDESGNDPVERLTCLLAADYCSMNVLAVHGYQQSSGHSRLALLSSPLIEQLRNGQFLTREPPSTERFRLYDQSRYSEPDVGGMDAAALRTCRQAVARIARRLRSNQPTPAEVCIQAWRGHASERLWLKVVGAKSAANSSWQLHGELTTNSTLWPHLRAGLHVVVQPYDVVEVRGE